MSKGIVSYFALSLLLLLAIPPRGAWALSPPEGFAPGPDVIMGNLPSLTQAGNNGTQVGLAMGTDICNNGDVPVDWFRLPETDHPVIPQNLYRLSGGANNDDRFEQIGQSWGMHQFFPLQNNACGFGCTSAPDSAHLGVGCSTADTAGINASQSVVGSRAWVNPFTGIFPSTSNSHTGHTHDGTTHRILVEGNDLSPAMNPGATYFGEAQLVTPHEYAWCQSHAGECNMFNNVSYRQFNVVGTTSFNFSPVGSTVRTPAIFVWPGATIQTIEPAPGVDGRAFIAYKVTCQGGLPITCDYEYAIYNENLDRGIQSFSVPGGCGFGTPANLEFHAPLNHPGIANDGTVGDAGYSNAPWTASGSPAAASWHTETFAQNPNANALRWGTLYNFRFRSGTGPRFANATIGFFKTGDPITVAVVGPNDECQPSPSPSVTPPPSPTATPTASPSSTVIVDPTPTATPTGTATPTPTPTATSTPTPTPIPTPVDCAWTLAPVLPIPIYGEAVTSLGGNLYSFGGRTGSAPIVNSYKFDGTAWTVIAPLPVALYYAAAVSDGTYAYILGGADVSGTSTANVYRYDPVANTYATLAPFAQETQSHTAVYLDGKIYKFCGFVELKLSTHVLEIYNIATNSWTFGATCPTYGQDVAGFTDGDFIYAAGGLVPQPVVFSTKKTHRYDPATNTWNDTAIADLPVAREKAVGAFYNGGGVVAGGHSNSSAPLASAIRWDPGSNTWSDLPDMFGGRSDMGGAVLNGSFYVVGGYIFTPTNDVQKVTCPAAPSPSPATKALNLSTRMLVQTGDNVGIGGFIISGNVPKRVLLRAIGPSLTQFGVPNVLADPVLDLHGPGTFVTITNNNWRDTQEDVIQATGLPPANNLEAAIVSTLVPGAYTAIVRGNGNTPGVALVEVYDLNQEVNARLANLSTRAFVSTGDNIVIAGFTLGGPPQAGNDDRIIVRGIGPSLTALGVPNALADPTLELRDANGSLLIVNNDWQENPEQAAEITAAGLAPTNSLESALAARLPPGAYTALLAERNNHTGLGLVEIYDRGPL
jgi:hypothetical protein